MPCASSNERFLRATLCLLLGIPWSGAAAVSSDEDRRPLPVRAPTDLDYYENGAPATAKVELGRLLFFDKILSGNRNVSCATCHHPALGTSDSVALSLGEGASGRGRERTSVGEPSAALYRRLPRNSPALFNVGAKEFRSLFHDGRVELLAGARLRSPAKRELPPGLDSVLAAQALFPVSSADEMAGHPGENEVSEALGRVGGSRHRSAWRALADRLRRIPAYVELFREAFPRRVRTAADVTYVDAANALAAFESVAFRSDTSPFDRMLRGQGDLSAGARRGMELFYGGAGCADCHSGPFQTDHDFHAIAVPQIGPGKGDGHDLGYWQATGQRAFVEDYGRGRVTRVRDDRYRFRTPSLRNVARTGPWGHSGAFDTLEAVVRHHLDPERSVEAYRARASALPEITALLEERGGSASVMTSERRRDFLARDGWVQSSPELRRALAEANELEPVELTDAEIEDVLEFLHALTDAGVEEMSRWVPGAVPSGLPVVD